MIRTILKDKKALAFCVLSVFFAFSAGYVITKDMDKAPILGTTFVLSASSLMCFYFAGYDFISKKPTNRKVYNSIVLGVFFSTIAALFCFMYRA